MLHKEKPKGARRPSNGRQPIYSERMSYLSVGVSKEQRAWLESKPCASEYIRELIDRDRGAVP